MIRRATPADAAPLAMILGDWLRATEWMPVLHSRDEDRGFLTHLIGTAEVWVADDGVPLGFAAADGDMLDCLYLAPAARGHGIGLALLDRVRRERDMLQLWAFQANDRAIAFYRRNGFAEIARTDGAGNEERLPDILMEWRR